jgi:hypothetical protein
MLQKDGDIDVDVSHRIKARWMKWRQASVILSDKRVPQKLKGKFCRTAIRPAMLYGAECWPTKRRHVQQLSVAEMHMLCWICGHTRMDQVWNDDIRDHLGVAPIEEKLVQHRFRWFGHVQCSRSWMPSPPYSKGLWTFSHAIRQLPPLALSCPFYRNPRPFMSIALITHVGRSTTISIQEGLCKLLSWLGND